MSADELAKELEFVAANYIAIIGDLYLMDVAHFLKEQATMLANQQNRIEQLEIQLYGSR